MRVFVTGSTGFIGSLIVRDLIAHGHRVLGLTRSKEGATALTAAGAEPLHGSLEDLDSLRRGASQADGIIHTAFNHDFSKFQENCENDRRVIEAMGSELRGPDRPLIITSGTLIANTGPGELAKEDSPALTSAQMARAASEEAVAEMAKRGLNTAIMRLPQVHDPVKQGLVTYAIEMAREKGVSAYIGDGSNRWPAAHVSDVAPLYRLALEKQAESKQHAIYHAVAEEGVSMRAIAETIARGLRIPAVSISAEEAPAHFGWLAMFAGRDAPASGALTRQRLGWSPTGPGMIADLEAMNYG